MLNLHKLLYQLGPLSTVLFNKRIVLAANFASQSVREAPLVSHAWTEPVGDYIQLSVSLPIRSKWQLRHMTV